VRGNASHNLQEQHKPTAKYETQKVLNDASQWYGNKITAKENSKLHKQSMAAQNKTHEDGANSSD
jgi:hypothetical protein